jgi:hypothetical protein
MQATHSPPDEERGQTWPTTDTTAPLADLTQATFKNILVNPDHSSPITIIDRTDPTQWRTCLLHNLKLQDSFATSPASRITDRTTTEDVISYMVRDDNLNGFCDPIFTQGDLLQQAARAANILQPNFLRTPNPTPLAACLLLAETAAQQPSGC